jgi:excisionase family DNA binding protein
MTGFSSRMADSRAMDGPRFLQLADVAEILNISAAQTYALVRSGDLPAIKVGGRGQWRVERDQLEGYIARAYDETKEFVSQHPLNRAENSEPPAD